MIIIGASARNAGKTTLACRVIEFFSQTVDVCAIKISVHEDSVSKTESEINCVFEEHDFHTKKDTSRMLRAGAKKAFLINSNPQNIEKILIGFFRKFPPNTFFVCESNNIAYFAKEGLRLYIDNEGSEPEKKSAGLIKDNADYILHFNGSDFNYDIEELCSQFS